MGRQNPSKIKKNQKIKNKRAHYKRTQMCGPKWRSQLPLRASNFSYYMMFVIKQLKIYAN